jgi:hypothetical protein
MSGSWVQVASKNKNKKVVEIPKEEKIEEVKEVVFDGIRYFDEEWDIYFGGQISDVIYEFKEMIEEDCLPFMNLHFSVKGYDQEKTIRNYLKLFLKEADQLYEEIEEANETLQKEIEEENYYNEFGELEYKKKYKDFD